MSSKSTRNLKSVFQSVVGSDMKEWKLTRELAGAKGVVVRDFEHAVTKDKVKISEVVKYDQLDEMTVTYMNVEGSYKGKDVSGTLIIKPRID